MQAVGHANAHKTNKQCEFACTVTKYGIFSSDHAYKTKRLSQYKYKLSVIKRCHFQMNCSFLFWNSFRKVFMRKSDISSTKQISSWQVLLHVINHAILPLKWLVKANMEKIVYKPTFSRTAAQHNWKKKKREDLYTDIPWIIKELEEVSYLTKDNFKYFEVSKTVCAEMHY